jgi:hypothetical protein
VWNRGRVAIRRVVVLADFGAILGVGLRTVLAEAGCVVVGDLSSADAVLLDLDSPTCATRARTLLETHPEMRVIACSADRPAMQVFTPAGGDGEHPLSSAALADALLRA